MLLPRSASAVLNSKVLEQLACPICFGRLNRNDSDPLIQCTECGRTYPVVDGIPILIPTRSH